MKRDGSVDDHPLRPELAPPDSQRMVMKDLMQHASLELAMIMWL